MIQSHLTPLADYSNASPESKCGSAASSPGSGCPRSGRTRHLGHPQSGRPAPSYRRSPAQRQPYLAGPRRRGRDRQHLDRRAHLSPHPEAAGTQISVPWLFQLHIQRAGVNFAAPFGGAATAYTWVGRLGAKKRSHRRCRAHLGAPHACVYVATLVVVVITFAVSGRPLFAVLGVIAMIAIVLLSIAIARKGQGDWKTLQRWARKLPERFQDRVLAAIERFKEHQLAPQDLMPWSAPPCSPASAPSA